MDPLAGRVFETPGIDSTWTQIGSFVLIVVDGKKSTYFDIYLLGGAE